ncbi:acyltransferase [Xenorhabdus vietnamensis]|uniref:Acyltransferase n=1 Tax=Xenorhabdus vietnamensis TaxID=351656 RepID=A0A1Y2SFN7_9GAMM|nr:hypothetical protein [Xenorhabdus vietnamensis]OTA17573.1 acyltransferase [Xenorhabdus vietnamensis]
MRLFRIYPLAPTLQLLAKKDVGRRMDFDIEIMVRLFCQVTESQFVPTQVTVLRNKIRILF